MCLKSQIESLESTIDSMKAKAGEHESDLNVAEEARLELKRDLEEINGKLVMLEEELYETK